MRVTLVPPIVYLNDSDNPYHMGLLSLKAILKEEEHQVEIVNLNPILSKPYDSHKPHESVLTDEFYAQAITDVLASKPDLIGFSTVGASYPTILLLIQRLKVVQPDLIIICGGIQASLCARDTLEHFPEIDYIIAGEAEVSFPIFLQHLHNTSPFPSNSGIYYRTNEGEINYTGDAPLIQDLDTLPMIDYRELDIASLSEINIDVGRGCPFQCYYCCTNNYWHRTYRLRSAESIVNEIEFYHLEYGQRQFAFNHDLLTCNRKRFKELLDTLEKRNLPIHWRCSSRIDTIDEELLSLMAKTGCYHIFFGVETGSPHMQKVIKKNLDLSRVLPLIQECRNLNIDCTVSFICGMPEETLEDLLQTIELLYECTTLFISAQIHLLAPFQGTGLYRQYKDQLQFDGNYSNVGGFVINNQQEETLIKAYPELFSNFYYINNPHIDRSLLRNIQKFPRVLGHFWRTIGILRFTHNISLKDILLTYLDQLVDTEDIPEFIKSWITALPNTDPQLQQVFEFELALFTSRFISKVEDFKPTPVSMLTPEAYFWRCKGSKLHLVNFDPAEVEDAIRQHKSLKQIEFSKELVVMISAPRKGAIPQYSTVPTNSSVISIYNDATGDLQIQAIIQDATDDLHDIYSPEEIHQSVINIFKQLIHLRLVSIGTKGCK